MHSIGTEQDDITEWNENIRSRCVAVFPAGLPIGIDPNHHTRRTDGYKRNKWEVLVGMEIVLLDYFEGTLEKVGVVIYVRLLDRCPIHCYHEAALEPEAMLISHGIHSSHCILNGSQDNFVQIS